MNKHGTVNTPAKSRKVTASTSKKKSQDTRHRQDDNNAMQLQNHIEKLGAEQTETLTRANRLEQRMEERKKASNRTSSIRKREKDLDKALDSLMKSVGDRKILD